jgi:hypothetical protein
MGVQTSAGTQLYVSAALPAALDVAGYEALTYTVVGEITDLPEFGIEYNTVTHLPLGTRALETFKGSFSEAPTTLELGLDNSDAGQVILNTALGSDDNYSFKVVLQNGDTYYRLARVTSFKITVGGPDNIVSASVMLSPKAGSSVQDLAA